MRMKIKISILLILLSIAPIVCGQNLQEVRVARLLAIDAYDKMSLTMLDLHNVGKNYYLYDEFVQLFSDNAIVYNDLLPNNIPQYVSPAEYISIYADRIAADRITFHSLELNDLPTKQDDGSFVIPCRFTKSVIYKTLNGYNYPKYSFKYTMTVTIDANMEHALISAITPDYPLGNFFILRKHPNHEILYKNIPIDEYDDDNQRLFSADLYDLSSFSLTNSDFFRRATFLRDTIDNHFYYVDETTFDMVGVSLGVGIYSIGNRVAQNVRPYMDKLAQFNYPLQLMGKYSLQLSKKTSERYGIWFFNIGAALDWTNYQISTHYSHNIEAVDSDGETYLRSIDIKLNKESINKVDFTLPLTFEVLLPISSKNKLNQFFSIEFGIWGSVSLLDQIQFDANVSYKGRYDYFGGVTFDRYYDYGEYTINEKVSKPNYYINRWNFGGLGSLSYLLSIKENHMIKLGLQYKQGCLTPSYLPNDYILSYDKDHYQSLISTLNGWQGDLFLQLSYVHLLKRKK